MLTATHAALDSIVTPLSRTRLYGDEPLNSRHNHTRINHKPTQTATIPISFENQQHTPTTLESNGIREEETKNVTGVKGLIETMVRKIEVKWS
ncbi:hypothetical protein V6N12_009957 [Hibiscus sabdariffa]|uniref:Uncharacterized protein n=1 Tax=Hibiscus sabdariffa TaxID=183260 RepID=A0ABR2EC97_9ROSI